MWRERSALPADRASGDESRPESCLGGIVVTFMKPNHGSRSRTNLGRRGRAALRVELLEERAVPAAGDLDPTFGTGGVVTTNIARADVGHELVIQSDREIVVAGYTTTSTCQDF